jgi:peptidoglycan hydrolase-like protein with peptidoglycan-binding domain
MPAGADTALVVGTVDAASTTSYGAPRYLGTAFTPLDQAGFDLLSAIDADAATLSSLMSALVTADEQDRLVIALSGRFVHYGNWTWFLGRDAGTPDLGNVSARGLSLQLLMDYAAASPARVVILLAPENQTVPLGAGLEDGIGDLTLPEGLTVATGHPASVSRFLRSGLLVQGQPLRDGFAQSPDLTVLALDDGFTPFIPTPVVVPAVPPAEQAYWEAMATLNNVFAYRAYLNRYPSGYYAAEAQARIAVLEPPQPQLTPEEAEQALGLSREQRRDIQRDLAVLGYYSSGIDGLFGAGTRGGIRQWQQVNGLQVTGYLDAAQITRLSDQADVRREQLRAEDRAYWQQTGQGQDEAGLRAYLGRYPNGEYATLARQRLDAIEAEQERQADIAYWNQTGRGQDEAGLRAYLARYPDGEFSQLARQRLNAILAQQEQQAWQLAQSRDTIQSYRAYLNDYPNGPHAAQARQRLAQLEQAAGEPAAWQQAQARDTLNSYQAYLDAYPNGPHAAEARALMRAIRDDDRAWNLAESTDTIQGYRNYLNSFPTPRHRQEALDRISQIQADEQAWQQAQAADTIPGYRRYLQLFPSGRHEAEANARISQLTGGGGNGGGGGTDPAIGAMSQRELLLARSALRQFGIIAPNAGTEAEIIAGLRQYQAQFGLQQTGILDAATLVHMTVRGLLNQD